VFGWKRGQGRDNDIGGKVDSGLGDKFGGSAGCDEVDGKAEVDVEGRSLSSNEASSKEKK